MSIFHGKKCISCDHRGLGVTSKSRLSQHNLKSLNSPFIAESSWEALRTHRCCSVPILAPLRPFCFLSSSCPSLLFYYSPFLLGSLLPSFHPSVLCCTSSFLLSSSCCTSISSLALICLFPFSFLFFFSHTSPGVVADASVLFSSAGSHDTYAVFFLSACFLSLSAVTQHSFYSVPPNCFLQPVLCILHTFEFKYCHIM